MMMRLIMKTINMEETCTEIVGILNFSCVGTYGTKSRKLGSIKLQDEKTKFL